VRDDIGEALKWRRMRDEKKDVHVNYRDGDMGKEGN
jgi:hypothetical protein